MRYIGARTCYCSIEDDPYMGSGSMLKKDIEKYGKQYFKKTILCVCKTAKEAYEKEKQLIQLFDAVNSKEYYNIAFGGPSRPDGFIATDEEIEKREYLMNKLNSQKYYGIKVLEREPNKVGKPRIILAEIFGNEYWRTTTISDDVKYNNKRAITMINENNTFQYKSGILEWFQGNGGYTLISEQKYYDCLHKLMEYKNFDAIVEEVRAMRKCYADKNITIKVQSNVKMVNDADVKPPTAPTAQMTNIDYIKMYAKTSQDYNDFLKLLNKYNNLGLIAVYNAVTGCGSISGKCFKDGNFKCTKKQINNAYDILDYESKFSSMVQTIGGRHDYMYIAIGFCYSHNKINNDELFKKFKNKYKKIEPIQSIEHAFSVIEYLYNFRTPINNKVFIKHEYNIFKKSN